MATRSAYLAWLAVCLIWGTTYLAIRVALETVPPALVGAIRFTIAGVILIVILRARGERLPDRLSWGALALVGGLLIGLGNGGVVWAEQSVPSGFAALIVASIPFWMSGIEAALPGGERLTARIVAGLIVGFSGIVLLVWPDLTAGGVSGRQFAVGVIALQVACFGWAIGSSYARRRAREENALGAAAFQMLFGGLLMALVATALGEWQRLTFTWRSGLAELYLLVIGSLAAYPAYVYALKYLPVSTVSLYAYINPVIAVVLGTLLLDEPFGPRVIVAAALVFLGIAVVRWKPKVELGTRSAFQVPDSDLRVRPPAGR
jgi:drug/metabolite transporter (DMT)-like permease